MQRYYCKRERRTVSLLPIFCHTRKRYGLSTAILGIVSVVDNGHSMCAAARMAGVDRRTLRRWVQGWSHHEQQKRMSLKGCGSDAVPGPFGAVLVRLIRALGSGRIATVAAEAMLRLMKSHNRPLY